MHAAITDSKQIVDATSVICAVITTACSSKSVVNGTEMYNLLTTCDSVIQQDGSTAKVKRSAPKKVQCVELRGARKCPHRNCDRECPTT